MKIFYSLAIITSLCFMSLINATEKNAIMMDKVEDPLAGVANIMGAANFALAKNSMGETVKATSYKHCVQNISIDKNEFKMMADEMKKESVENDQYNDIKSVTLIVSCPLTANGKCDHGTRVEFFYTNSKEFLNDQREGCEYFNKKWTSFDVKSIDSPMKKDDK